MKFAYSLSGSAPLMMSYQIASTVVKDIPLRIPAAEGAGLATSTTTSAADMVGVCLDAGTYVTAQQTDGTSAEREVRVIINPDAVWRMRMSGGATANTALTLYPVTTESTDGLTITTGTAWNSPDYDEGYAWGYDGANAGSARKIVDAGATSATVLVAFDQDLAVGDNFLRCPYSPVQGILIQLTADLTQADASIVVGTGAHFKTIELELRDIADSGQTNSNVLALPTDHVWGPRPT